MRVTALVENTAVEGRQDLRAEHGLSLHVVHDGGQILFDTGGSEAFARNAERLGIDIEGVDTAVLSHHHSDHGGGLSCFLDGNHRAKVYLGKSETEDYYFRFLGPIRMHVGLDSAVLQRHAHRIQVVEGMTEVSTGVHVLTRIEGPYAAPKGNRRLVVGRGRAARQDGFEHELMLVIEGRGGLVVFTGCSHRGILNMIHTARQQFGGAPIKAVFGGFHLIGLPMLNTMAGSRREVEGIGRALQEYEIGMLYTGHCTGPKAYRVLKGVLGERLQFFPTGSSVEV